MRKNHSPGGSFNKRRGKKARGERCRKHERGEGGEEARRVMGKTRRPPSR